MSDPVIAPAAPAPVAEPTAAAPAPEAPKPARVNPYARSAKPAAPVAAPAADAPQAAAPAPAAKPTVQKGTRLLALREAEIAKLKPVVAEHGEAMALLAPVVKAKLEALPEKARKALEVNFKDKPLALLREIQRLDEMGLLAQPAAPPPATTAAPPGPPVGGEQAVDPDLAALAKWLQLQKQSPTSATMFFAGNRAAIQRAQQKTAPRN